MDDEELSRPDNTLESSLQVIALIHEVRPVQTKQLVLEAHRHLRDRYQRIAQPIPIVNCSGNVEKN